MGKDAEKNKGNKPQLIAKRLVLLRDYLYANASKTKAVSIQSMKDYLHDQGDNCGIKPINRALNILYEDFGLQIEYSEKLKGWLCVFLRAGVKLVHVKNMCRRRADPLWVP